MTDDRWEPEEIEAFAYRVTEVGQHNRSEASAWRRWALASCLTINGGASIALMNLSVDQIDADSRFWAVVWCLGGIVVSIIYGFVSAHLISEMAQYLQKSGWTMTKKAWRRDGAEVLDVERLEQLQTLISRTEFIQYAAPVFFVTGLGIALEGIR